MVGGILTERTVAHVMDYSLLWNGAVRTVTLPPMEELEGDRARWTWAAVRLTGGSVEAAWRAALAVDCPGLAWGSVVAPAKSFDACVFGSFCDEAVSDTSSYVAKPKIHNPTHRAPRPDRAPLVRHAGSDSAGPHRPRTQRPTSSASSRPGIGAGVAHPRSARPPPRPHATPGKAGWMGRDATKRPVSAAAPHA